MQNIICEAPVVSNPKNIKKYKDKIRMEAVLQTVNDLNRNRRIYDKQSLQESIHKIMPRIKEKSFLGELDHPNDSNPARQLTVLYKEASHVFLELGWEGNKLVGVLETLRTPNGKILQNLCEDKIAVGFSYRGMGELQETFFEGQNAFKVIGPLQTITWDSVSFPSHKEAKLVKVTENVSNIIMESLNLTTFTETSDGMICTKSGVCYLPNTFDRLVEQYKKKLLNKF